MNSPGNTGPAADHKPGIIRWIIVSIIFLILIAASLFLSAGTLEWPAAWMYIILAGSIQLLDALVLIPISPELLGERSRPQSGAKKWDQILSRLMATIGPLTIWIVSGLDYRYAWSPEFPGWLVIISAICVFGGGLLVLWAMAANRFFIGMVRIQDERGHLVIKSGPYQYVRHPGYLGSLFFILFTPIMLGSLWALIPAGLTCGIVFTRTYLEDQTLQAELQGYQEYTDEVAYKLVPGVW